MLVEFFLTSVFNSKITEVENKIPDIKNLASKTELATVENEIPNISSFVTKSELTTVETKIPDINGFVKKKKTDYSAKINELENKIPNVSGLVSLTKFATELKKVDDKVSLNKIKNNDIDSAYFRGKTYFDDDDGTQNYSVFQCVYKYFKRVIDSTSNNTYTH